METARIVLDADHLKAANAAAKRHNVNRSELVRRALREHLERLHVRDLEERDRLGYQHQPQRVEEYRAWEEAAAWPEDRAEGTFAFAGSLHRTNSDRFPY